MNNLYRFCCALLLISSSCEKSLSERELLDRSQKECVENIFTEVDYVDGNLGLSTNLIEGRIGGVRFRINPEEESTNLDATWKLTSNFEYSFTTLANNSGGGEVNTLRLTVRILPKDENFCCNPLPLSFQLRFPCVDASSPLSPEEYLETVFGNSDFPISYLIAGRGDDCLGKAIVSTFYSCNYSGDGVLQGLQSHPISSLQASQNESIMVLEAASITRAENRLKLSLKGIFSARTAYLTTLGRYVDTGGFENVKFEFDLNL